MSRDPRGSAVLLSLAAALLLPGCQRTDSEQHGYRGTAAVQLAQASQRAALADLNRIPPPEDPADTDSPTALETFENVKVLDDTSATELSRLMQAMSTWVSPVEGCDFCHNPDKLESDEKYPKVVARRMVEMTRKINTEWKSHVGETGVTCWTCHRGEAVPSGDWFAGVQPGSGALAHRAGQNHPAREAGGSALPVDALSFYLTDANEVRIQGTQPLAGGNRHSIKQAEWTYSLMIYMAQSLGVNCTYCHNTRALANWQQSTPQRVTAWHGIRMVRQLNTEYLGPIAELLPAHRMGPLGDGPKIGCATCHKGSFKPLNGVSPLTDYQVLAGRMKTTTGAAPASLAPALTAQAATPAAR